MGFVEDMKSFSERIEKIKDKMQTEEAIKTSIVLPFFQLLGYDIFNPEEFIPEYTADVGIKKGEKIDYVIACNQNPIMLIEVKNCPNRNLKRHTSQLFRYFAVSKARFGILTNGFSYVFYTDLDEKNIMDTDSYFEFDLLNTTDKSIVELKRYGKSEFCADDIYDAASELRYLSKISELILTQCKKPTDSFIHYVLGEIYKGRRTKVTIDKFRDLIKLSMNNILSGNIGTLVSKEDKGHLNDEIEAFLIVKSIIRSEIACDRISYRSNSEHIDIFIDNDTNKWICRIKLRENKTITLPHCNEAGELVYDFDVLDDIFELKDDLLNEALKHKIKSA